eukprot:8659159-Ditylum_brightwellii.AAC.1
MTRSKRNKHLVCNEDNNVDDSDDDGVDDNGNDGIDNGAEGADKHLAHLSQVTDCCRMERKEQNKHLVCNKGYDVDDSVDDGDNDSVCNGDDGCVDDGAEGANKHMHISLKWRIIVE